MCTYIYVFLLCVYKKVWLNLAQSLKDEYKITAQGLFKLWTQRGGEQHSNINSVYVQNSDIRMFVIMHLSTTYTL